MYVTLYGSGQVARFAPAAPNGAEASRSSPPGRQHPYGHRRRPARRRHHRLPRLRPPGPGAFGPPGIPHDTALPAGFHPQRLAISGTDTWVTDDTAAHVAAASPARPPGSTAARSAATTGS